ncbi:MAG: thioredoxin domain-containing protein [Cyanobacteria bacterium QS_8_64_29]|nr:MAG: thioredoxin domain-containing protein [Cyanobacteria bacterium QS_8_64_29]
MANCLAHAASLYLRKHADNPVDWWPWCREALDKASAEDKPIFLSVGYSSCHWCTVMEGEAFSNQSIAAYLNANFVPIKVDREERPDLDSIYMQALQMMTGQGGWPLNVFLTPTERTPFYGGTYFPVEPRFGRPGFLEVLKAVRRFYDNEKDKLHAFTQEVQARIQQASTLAAPERDPLTEELLQQGMEASRGVLSDRDSAPNFPTIPYAHLALRSTRFTLDSQYDARQLCQQRGWDLTLGGIYDHVGGGFHRYTVDATWTVPHFEKMLYDNGQILEYLADLWSAGFTDPAYERAVAGTLNWLQREMTAPEGYFYAAQDADSFTDATASEPEEGAFYTWSYSELAERLTQQELGELQAHFSVTQTGNFEGCNVLQRHQGGELPQAAETALQKLFAARYGDAPDAIATHPPARDAQEAQTGNWPGRIPPVTDTKAIVAWNGMAISGLARAYSVFGYEACWTLAAGAARFLLERQWHEGCFYRLNYAGEPAVTAQAEDYALAVKALLDLHAAAPQQEHWLEAALELQAAFDERLWGTDSGGYYNTSRELDDELLVRERGFIDNATPSANGIALANLVRLHLLAERTDYLERAERGLNAFGSILQQYPQACPSLMAALDWYRHATLARAPAERLQALGGQYHPCCAFRLASSAGTELPDGALGLVCQGLSCLEPARSQAQLQQQLQASQTR